MLSKFKDKFTQSSFAFLYEIEIYCFLFIKKSLNLLPFINQILTQHLQPHKDSDMVLWQNLKEGNLEALGLLYDMFIDELFLYGSHFSHDRQKVMDSIHDLFLNLYKYRKKLASTDNVKYYLFRSLKNQILKEPKSSIFFIDKNSFANNVGSQIATTSYEDELIEAEFLNERAFRLSDAMNALSKKQKQCIFLRFNEERHYEEIAEIMNVSVQTSRTIIYRAIKILRANLTLFFLFSLLFL